MSLLATLWAALTTTDPASPGCFACRHFCDDPQRVEAVLPGLKALSSAHAAVRAQDGLCLEHGLVVNGRRRCVTFSGWTFPA